MIRSPTDLPRLVDSLDSLALAGLARASRAPRSPRTSHRAKSEARFRSLVAHSSDLITVLDAERRRHLPEPVGRALLGYRADEVEGTRVRTSCCADDRPLPAQILRVGEAYAGGGAETHVIECSLRHRDGTLAAVRGAAHATCSQDEHVRGIVLNSRDVSERKAFEDQLAHQAFHDPVTSLANRALFADRVEHSICARRCAAARSIGVMFIDLDDFKTVNDSLGHAAGDTVLQEVARRLAEASGPPTRSRASAATSSPILLDGIEGSDEAADDRRPDAARTSSCPSPRRQAGLPARDVGICISDEDRLSQDAEELLRNADVAMYMAKRDSKGRYRVFEPTMHERVVERLELRGELQRALDENQLEVHYQPVVRLDRRQRLRRRGAAALASTRRAA